MASNHGPAIDRTARRAHHGTLRPWRLGGGDDRPWRRGAAGGRTAAGEVHGEPAGAICKRPWGERSSYAVDPFGNPLCFVDRATVFTG